MGGEERGKRVEKGKWGGNKGLRGWKGKGRTGMFVRFSSVRFSFVGCVFCWVFFVGDFRWGVFKEKESGLVMNSMDIGMGIR